MRIAVRVANPNNRDKTIEVDSALVDTGATWTTIPRTLADELGLDIVGQVRARTAAGELTLDQTYAYLQLQKKEIVSFVLVSDTYPSLFIGETTLEGLGLAVDPVNERLVDSELLLL